MAATNDHANFDIGHPAPDRDRVGFGLLMLSLFAAPAIWSLQHLLIYGLASLYCSSAALAPAATDVAWVWWLLVVVNLGALLGAGLALALAVRNVRRTRHEYGGESGGVMDAGEGRTRFLSIWGIWLGGVFILAIAFNTISVFWVGLCGV